MERTDEVTMTEPRPKLGLTIRPSEAKRLLRGKVPKGPIKNQPPSYDPKADLKHLKTKYPRSFGKMRPLEIGAHVRLKELTGWSATRVKRVLEGMASKPVYQKNIIYQFAHRWTIEGVRLDAISDAERAAAVENLKAIEKRIRDASKLRAAR